MRDPREALADALTRITVTPVQIEGRSAAIEAYSMADAIIAVLAEEGWAIREHVVIRDPYLSEFTTTKGTP